MKKKSNKLKKSKKNLSKIPKGIETTKSISQIMKEYLDSDGKIVTNGGHYYGKNFNDLLSVINGTADNYLIFDNAGGKVFDIWIYDKKRFKGSLKGFEDFITRQIRYAYMCRINGKETVFRMLPNYHVGGKSW